MTDTPDTDIPTAQFASSSYVDTSPFARLLSDPLTVEVVDVALRKHYERLSPVDVADLVGTDDYRAVRTRLAYLERVGVLNRVFPGEYTVDTDSELVRTLRDAQTALLSASARIPHPDTDPRR